MDAGQFLDGVKDRGPLDGLMLSTRDNLWSLKDQAPEGPLQPGVLT